MPSTTSSSVSRLFASSTVITPSLPTFSIALAIISPISRSPLAEMVPTWAISSLVETFLERFFTSSTTASTAWSMPRFTSIGFMPAATAFIPSRTIACARTVAVVVPSPATSLVFWAASRTIWAPMFSNLSSSSISLATVTPSLVVRGAPNDFSITTLRPLGPSVTLTALARMSTPRNMRSRASVENFTSLAAMRCYSFGFRDSSGEPRLTAPCLKCVAAPSRFGVRARGPAQRTALRNNVEQGPLRAGWRMLSVQHAHDVAFLHDQQLLAVDLDLGAGPFAEQHLVTFLHVKRNELAAFFAGAGANRQHLPLLGFLGGGVWDDDAAGAFRFAFETAHDHAIVKRTQIHVQELPMEVMFPTFRQAGMVPLALV